MGRKVGLWTGTVGGVVSGILASPLMIRLEPMVSKVFYCGFALGVIPKHLRTNLQDSPFAIALPWISKAFAALHMMLQIGSIFGHRAGDLGGRNDSRIEYSCC